MCLDALKEKFFANYYFLLCSVTIKFLGPNLNLASNLLKGPCQHLKLENKKRFTYFLANNFLNFPIPSTQMLVTGHYLTMTIPQTEQCVYNHVDTLKIEQQHLHAKGKKT